MSYISGIYPQTFLHLHAIMEEIIEYLKNKTYPQHVKTLFEKRNFRRLCTDYAIRNDGVLLKKGKRVLNDDELQRVLDSVHSQPHGGHLGVNKT